MKIKFNHITRTFGIHSDRVRNTVIDRYKDKYGKDSNEYKDFKERKELLDELESREDEVYRPYGYAASPERVTRFIEDQNLDKPQGFDSSRHDARSVNRERVNKRHRRELEDEFMIDLFNRYDENNKTIFNKLRKYRNGNRLVTPEFIDQFNNLKLAFPGSLVTEEPRGSEVLTETIRNPITGKRRLNRFVANINKNGSDFEAPHELQHLINKYYGYNKITEYDLSDFNKLSNILKYRTLMNPDRINDYISNVLQEELSANRARTMYPWIASGRKFKGDSIKDSYDEGVLSQSTYESRIGGYKTPSLRYNVDPELQNKILENTSKL